jgi:N-formylglutamate amidohydrolase
MIRTSFLALYVALLPLLSRADAPKPAELISVQEGTLPLVLTAPHGGTKDVPGVTAKREGKDVTSKFVTAMDTNTDQLAAKIAAGVEKRLGAKPHLIVAKFARKYVDANRAATDAYESPAAAPVYEAYHAAIKKACDQVVSQYGRGFLIDVHGQAAVPGSILRGTGNGQTDKALVAKFGRDAITGPNSVLGFLEKSHGYSIFPPAADETSPEDKRYNGGHTVRTYGSGSGGKIDALQMEFGGSLRTKDKLDQTADDVADAIAAFVKEYLPKEKK